MARCAERIGKIQMKRLNTFLVIGIVICGVVVITLPSTLAALLPISPSAHPPISPSPRPPISQSRPVHTYSIVARDPATGELGVAVQSHWFSVGPIVAWAEAGRRYRYAIFCRS